MLVSIWFGGKYEIYEPQRHNAADAAHKGEHKKKILINPLCPLRLCGSIRLYVLKDVSAFF